MITLTLSLIFAVIVSGVTRRCGHSRPVAFAVAVTPSLVAFIYFAIRHDIEIGPHGGIFPAWIVAGVVLVLSAIVSAIMVRLVRHTL